MLSERYPRYSQLKRCAKFLAKRYAIRLTLAQEALCRASGFRNLNQLSPLCDSREMIGDRLGGPSQEEWSRRLRGELGADYDELFPKEDQTVWWRRIHGRHESDNAADE